MSSADLLDAVRSLFPASLPSIGRVARRDFHALRLIPPGERAKLAVPASSSRAAAQTIWRPSAADGLARTTLRASLATAERMRLLRLATRDGILIDCLDGSIVEHLSSVFQQDVLVGLMVGSARANRKPVLNVFSERGQALGFAKVGLGALANRLVAAEADALRRLEESSLRKMRVPSVISDVPWRENSVLVMTPLRTDRMQRMMDVPAAALDELAETVPPLRTPIQAAPWGRRMLDEVAAMPDASILADLATTVMERYGDFEMRFAPWHGDFGPWNMARTSSAPMVWDWERFQDDMPRGLDAVHFLVHRAIADKGGESLSTGDLLTASARALSESGGSRRMPTARAAEVLLAAYLLTYAVRFIGEGRAHDVSGTTNLGMRYAGHLGRLLEADQNPAR